jgi:hypothetical protein
LCSSGEGAGLDNPAHQDLSGDGPIPVGLYTIGHGDSEHPALGSMVVRLTPIAGNRNRADFFMEGDNRPRGVAPSEGCIFANLGVRALVSSGYEGATLAVVPGTRPIGAGVVS